MATTEFMTFLLQLAEEKNKELQSKESQKMVDDTREFRDLCDKIFKEKYQEQINQMKLNTAEEELKNADSRLRTNNELLSLGQPHIEEIHESLGGLSLKIEKEV